MIQEVFEQIAEKENGKCSFRNQTIHLGSGVRGEEVTSSLAFKYKGNLITVLYKLGVSNVATVTCYLNDEVKIKSFKITSITHLLNLILRKKHRLVVKSKDSNLKDFIHENKSFSELALISNRVNFSPTIIYNKKEATIVTEYFLEFPNKQQVVKPTIAFYKDLIDVFLGKN